MRELVEKYKEWYKDTPHKWKVALINKCRKDGIFYVDIQKDIDWIYDDCIDYIFSKTTRRVENLAKKMGYSEPPCYHCQMIIKNWNVNRDYIWSPENAHLFVKK